MGIYTKGTKWVAQRVLMSNRLAPEHAESCEPHAHGCLQRASSGHAPACRSALAAAVMLTTPSAGRAAVEGRTLVCAVMPTAAQAAVAYDLITLWAWHHFGEEIDADTLNLSYAHAYKGDEEATMTITCDTPVVRQGAACSPARRHFPQRARAWGGHSGQPALQCAPMRQAPAHCCCAWRPSVWLHAPPHTIIPHRTLPHPIRCTSGPQGAAAETGGQRRPGPPAVQARRPACD